jgi:hypothetical protein
VAAPGFKESSKIPKKDSIDWKFHTDNGFTGQNQAEVIVDLAS